MGYLKGKIAVVTGAAGGIGTAIALALAEEGARVAACDLASRREDSLAPLADVISDKGGKAIAMAVDVSRKADIEAAVGVTLEAWGGIDILVNNAGTTAGAVPFLDITDAELFGGASSAKRYRCTSGSSSDRTLPGRPARRFDRSPPRPRHGGVNAGAREVP